MVKVFGTVRVVRFVGNRSYSEYELYMFITVDEHICFFGYIIYYSVLKVFS